MADDTEIPVPLSSFEFINIITANVDVFERDGGFDVAPDEPEPIGADVGTVVNSARSVLGSYIIPPETWLVLASPERRRNWVTPRIPPTVSLSSFDSFDPPRLAYVREYNWERQGVRGMFSMTHWARGNFGIGWVLGSPISPSLYTYVNESMGQAGTNFAILSRNTHWVSAVIGGFDSNGADPDAGTFFVHYNDDGVRYDVLELPFSAFAEYVHTLVPGAVAAISWPAKHGEVANVRLGDAAPLLGTTGVVNTPTGSVPGQPDPLTGGTATAAAAAGTTTTAPLINEKFFGVDMTRFWPQFMVALEIALYSPIRSTDLLNLLRRKHHWVAIEQYMTTNRGKWRWVPPNYRSRTRMLELGKFRKPKYLKP